MALVAEDSTISPEVLRELFVSLRDDLAGLEESIDHPRGRVLDPASLRTASELLRAAQAELAGPIPVEPERLGRGANLAYGVLLAVIDLVKSHTDGPKVPRSSKASPPAP